MASAWLKYVFSNSTLKGLGFGAGVYYVDRKRMDNSIGKDSDGNALWGQCHLIQLSMQRPITTLVL